MPDVLVEKTSATNKWKGYFPTRPSFSVPFQWYAVKWVNKLNKPKDGMPLCWFLFGFF